MNPKKTRSGGRLLETSTKAAGSTVGIVAATSSLGVAGAGLSLVGGLAGAGLAIYDAWREHQDDRIRLLLQEAYSETASDEGFAAFIATRLKDPNIRRVFMASVQVALGDVASEILPALAALMREYERQAKPPDEPFRNLCRVLQDLSGEEYRSFREVFIAASRADLLEGPLLSIEWVIPAFGDFKGVTVSRLERGEVGVWHDDPGHQVVVEAIDPRHLRHLRHLLDLHRIANEDQGLARERRDGERMVEGFHVATSTARWLRQFLAK